MLSGKDNRNINVRNVSCAHGKLGGFVGYTFLPKDTLPNGTGFNQSINQSISLFSSYPNTCVTPGCGNGPTYHI
jgi:hypothetical protein